MSYLDAKKKSKKKADKQHVPMGRVGGQPKANPMAANQAGGSKNMLSRRKGER